MGAKNLDRLLDYFLAVNIDYLSLFVFSTENWKRPQYEVRSLWNLLDEYFRKKKNACLEKNIRVVISGDYKKLPQEAIYHIEDLLEKTKSNTGVTVNFCLNYGSRDEIVRACNLILFERSQRPKNKKDLVTMVEFASFLYTAELPEIDLMIRTGGEQRLSNFLLWQSAYAEIYFTETLWPDLDHREIEKILLWYQGRNRRFGGLRNVRN